MNFNLKKALLMGTAIVAVGTFAAGANAQTAVTSNTTFDDGTSGTNVSTLTTTAAPIVTINNAEVTFSENVTATGAANGVVGFITGGTSVLTVNADTDLTSTGAAATVTTADLAGITVNVAGRLVASANTETAIDFSSLGAANGGTIVITGGTGTNGDITGLITGGAGDDSLTINTAAGDSTIDGAVNLGGGTGDTIIVQGSGTTAFNSTVDAETINIQTSATASFDGNVTGNVGLSTSSIAEVTGGVDITGTVDNTSGSDNAGELILAGATTVSGNVGATNSLAVVAIGNGQADFSGTVNANVIDFDAAGTAVFADSVTATTLTFDGYDGTASFATGANFTGNIDNSFPTGGTSAAGTNVGTLTLVGSSVVTGNVGATNALKEVNTGANGSTSQFTGTVDATTINVTGTGVTDFDGMVDATTLTYADAGTVDVNATSEIDTVDFANNAGVLNVADDANITGSITSAGGADGTVNFAGTSTVTGAIGTSTVGAVNFNGGTGETVSVSGNIDATDVKIAGAGTVDAGADVTGAVDFDADGTLNLVAGATVTGAVGVSTMDQGTLNFAGAGALSSTLNAAGFELTTLSLNGDDTTVTVGGDAVAAKTNNIGNNTLNVTGTFTTEANDTLNFTVDGASSVGQVVSSGNATIDADTNVNVTIDTTEFIADGSSFTLVDGNNGGSAVADLNAGKLTLVGNSALLTFTQDTANDADLVVDVARVAVSTVSSNANTGALGGMLEANSGDAGLATVQSYIQTAATATELDERSEAVSPTADGAIFAAAAQSGAQSFSATNSRIDVARNGGADTGMVAGEMGEGLGMWAKAFGQSADQDTREGVSGYEADTYGVTVGLDSESIIDDGLLGVSFTYANTDVESDNLTSTDTDVDSYQISLYGTKDLNQGMYVSGMVGYAMNSVDQTRNNVAGSGQTANADFDGDQYMAYAEFGKDYMTNGMKITPKALVNYVHADYDGYTETGTSGANLTVGSTDVDVLELGVGVSAEWDLDDGNGNAIRPSLTAEYRYDVIGDEVQTTSSFTGGGASFKTEGFDPAQSAFLLGTGIQYDISDSVSMSADYGYQFKEDYDAHNVSIRAGVKF